MKREDVHRPAVINPADYEFVAQEYLNVVDLGTALWLKAERERIQVHMKTTGGRYSQHEHGGNCMVCGSVNAIYTSLFYHAKTNSYVRMGSDCTEKVYGQDFGAGEFRRRVQNALEAVAGKRKAQAYFESKQLHRAWEIYNAEERNAFQWEEVTISDIVSKLIKYGSISEKQENFIAKLLQQIDARVARKAQREAEAADASPVPIKDGRMTISGTVLALKEQDTQFGFVTKMLIQADAGFKLWGTRVANCSKGDYVRFDARVEASKNDPKFGFFSRPTKAEVISTVVQQI